MKTAQHKTINRSATVQPAASPKVVQRKAVAATMPVYIQTSPKISSPHDPAEKEADATAKKIMRMAVSESSVALVRTNSGGVFRQVKKEEKEKKIQTKLQSPYITRFMASGVFTRNNKEEGIIHRKAEGLSNVASDVATNLQNSRDSGSPMPLSVRRFMEPRFNANFRDVKVHTGDKAAKLSRQLNAQAFTVGNQIFFGKDRFKPESHEGKELIAHELTHTIQQGGAIQRSEEVSVTQQSPVHVQRWGVIDKALDYISDKVNMIPGFRMFTIVLGVNPINMSPVARSAANILRAIIELIPMGGLISQALGNSGVFEKAGKFVEQQIASLGIVGSAIKQAVTRFLDSLGWKDVLDLGGVWERAKRIFTEPIDRIISFAMGLVSGIVELVKDAILRPIAKLAEGTEGYALLKAVLGKDPITGDSVPQTAETIIGPFMKLIGQEEIWENMKKANAIGRAFAWFKGALVGLISFVREIPGMFINAFKSLHLADIILVPLAFGKLVKVFGGFIVRFVTWAGGTIWNLLEIIFEVVKPGALGYIKKTGGALKSILKNPLPFVGNLVKAAKLGFQNFADRFGTHLKAGLINWLTGSLPGVYIPQAFSLVEFGKFALSVFGISWAQIRGKIVKALGPTGEKIMQGIETTFDVVKALVTGGPAAAWEVIKEKLTNLKDMIVDGIVGFIRDTVVQKAIPKLIAMFIPGAGFISAIISIYDTVMVFVEKISKIVEVVKAFIDSIVAIAGGAIGAAAGKVESILAGLLSLAISFLAGFVGLGKVADKIMGVINKVRDRVDKALDAAIVWIVEKAKKLFGAVKGGVKKLIEWWKLKTGIEANGKKLTLYTQGTEDAPQVLVSSSPGKPWSEYLNSLPVAIKGTDPHKKATALAQKLEAKRKPITETDENKHAQATAKASKEMQEAFNELATQIKLLNGKSSTPASVITFGSVNSLGGATNAEASILSKEHPPGSAPRDYAPIWENLADLGSGLNKKVRKDWYVQGHLLNENLGGPGMRFNLTPITKQANNDHKAEVETGIKKKVNNEGLVLYYVVTPKPAWGTSLKITRLDELEKKNSPTKKEESEIESLKALRKLTRGFECRAYELEQNAAGKWVKKKSGFEVPKKVIDNDLIVGDQPYGY